MGIKHYVVTALVAAALASLLVSCAALPEGSAPKAGRAATGDQTSRPVWLRPVPPAVVLPADDEIDTALRPWQAGNYAGAAMWLEALADARPGMPMLDFYAGAGWLLAGVPADAVPALERALEGVAADQRGEVAWYLGLAHLELGQLRAARRAFDAACAQGMSTACRALVYLDTGADTGAAAPPFITGTPHSVARHRGELPVSSRTTERAA